MDEDFYIELWQDVKLTDEERDALCDAVDAGNFEEAERVSDIAWDRLFGEFLN